MPKTNLKSKIVDINNLSASSCKEDVSPNDELVLLREIINQSDNFIIAFNACGSIIQSNFTAQQLLGYSDENLLKQNITDVAELNSPIKKLHYKAKQPMNLKSANGKVISTKVSFKKVTTALGIKHIATIAAEDLNKELCLPQQNLVNTNQKLQSNYLKLVIDYNPALVYVKDLEGRILLANKAYGEYMGVDASDMVGMLISEFFFNEEALKNIAKEDAEIIKRNKTLTKLNHKYESPITGKPGWFNITKIPIQGPRPQILVVANNVTELYHAHKNLKSQTNKLSISNSELEQFAYIASHDLKEPLRMISSYLQLLENFVDTDQTEAKEYLNFALDGANRMQQLTTDLLHYSRLGTREKPFTQVDLNEVLDVVKLNLSNTISENKAVIINRTLPIVFGDFVQLTQLFQNLIENGIKFKSKEEPYIQIEGKEQKDAILLTFKDNGIGIEEGMHDRIFEIFQRLHTKEEFTGTGIGLSICKKIIEKHGGKVWVNGNKSGGSTFHATISTLIIE